MVIVSKVAVNIDAKLETCSDILSGLIPVVDLSDSSIAKKAIVEACKSWGFFKVINHGIPMELASMLESWALNFFALPHHHKARWAPSGYGHTAIGPNGDTGWLEYLLLSSSDLSNTFCSLASEYACAVRSMLARVLDMISDELEIRPRGFLSGLIGDEKSDSCFRVNHYPPCPDLGIGFGEHTDPQIMSVLRSSDAPGLQICLRNGSWASVPSDQTSFYFSVGDCLQVMTNGRFRSVKHRVVTNCLKSRVSMIYFGGPSLSEKIAPLSSLMEEDEQSLYEEFTWSEYKRSAYNSKLSDNRLKLFEKIN